MWGLAAADAVSMCGTRLSQIALPWLVLNSTGSASRAGLVAFAQLLPLVLVQALGGPFIDRAGARRVAIDADLASVVAVCAIPALHLAGSLTFPTLLALVAVTGLTRGPADVGHHALMPDIIKVTGQPTERVTGLIGTADRLAALTGAAVGGAVIAAIGPANALVLDSASFLLSAIILATTTRSTTMHAGAEDESPADSGPAHGSYLDELREGAAFLRHDTLLLGIVLAVAVTNMLDQGYSAVLLPAWAQQSGNGPTAIGLLGACMGGAALGGSLVATWLGPRLPRLTVYVVGFLVAAAPRWLALALDLPVPAIAGITLISGFGTGFLNPVLGALQFERIPDQLIGRVSATTLATAWMLMPLGGLLAGYATTHLDLGPTLVAFTLLYLTATLLPTVNPQWRAMDKHPIRSR